MRHLNNARYTYIVWSTILLTSSAQPGCYYEADYDVGTEGGVSVKDVIALSCTKLSVPVGVTVACKATIPAELAEAKRKLRFETDHGSFAEEGSPMTFEKVASRDGSADIGLVSIGPGTAKVTATTADVQSEAVEVRFEALAAAAVVTRVTAAGFALQASSLHELTATAELATADGTTPRPREVAAFELFRDANATVLHEERRIRMQTTSDASGRVSAIVSAGETTYMGPVWLRACPGTSVDASTCASLELIIVAPER